MSDYLWDQTGEPDEDTEQLEQLLGALKYQPRPLVIPDNAMPSATTPASARRRGHVFTFSRSHLAIAASLLMMILAGAWLVLRQREGMTTPQPLLVEKTNATGVNRQTEIAPGANVEAGETPSVNAPAFTNENAPQHQRMNALAVVHVVNQTHRSTRRVTTRQPRLKEALPTMPREEVALNGGAPPEGEGAITEEGRAATEQLMLALRLASAKLNYAQREVQEISRAAR